MTNYSELQLIDRVITYLGVAQKPYQPVEPRRAKLNHYPVEFLHLTRILHRLGEDFYGYQVADSGRTGLGQAVVYSILGVDRFAEVGSVFLEKLGLGNKSPRELCELLHINLMVIGPDEAQVQVIRWSREVDRTGFILVYRSYEELFYPIISLEKRACYLLYRHNNTLVQTLLSREGRSTKSVEEKEDEEND